MSKRMMPAMGVRDQWLRVVDEVAAAAQASGRQPSEITIVGVTKYVDACRARELFDAGCRDFGEARPQQLWEKREQLRDLPIRWHLIGHLQRNKVARTLRSVDLIHSVDSLRLAEALNQEASTQQRTVECLLEINVSGDANKHGFAPDAMPTALPDLMNLGNLHFRGLMGMASLEGGRMQAVRDFENLRRLRDQLASVTGATLANLSMGMSDDFPEAIAQGATLVRIGSRLWDLA